METSLDCRGARVGLFGGSFNPIHLGHLRSAEEIREAFQLARIYFIPAARPPHKSNGELAPAHHRLRMVELAVADNPFFSVSAVELERVGTSYSVDTIRYLLTFLQPASLVFVVGLDAFHELHTWKEYTAIPELCDLIVTSRPGIPTPHPEKLLPIALQDVFCYDSQANTYRHVSGHTLVLHQIEGLNIAASTIRSKVREGKSLRYLVPPAVAAYIIEHTLYQSEVQSP
jgi:nicotinate-nucleotide adenylyltransferase